MTTQAQGKSKKKNKDVMKLTLDEFNQIDAPHGHTVVSVSKVPGLDWAATMADHEQSSVETQQIVVPTETRAQRGPNVDLDSLPDSPPFKASLYNLAMSAEEKDVSDRFFQGLDVKRVDIQKNMTTVEFGSRDDLYEALCKDGTSFKGRTVNVCLFGQLPQMNNQDRFGGRGGNSPYGDRYGDRGYNNDRSGQSGGFGNYRSNDRYGDRPGGFSDRPGYDRSGGFGDRDRGRDGGFGMYSRGGNAGYRGPPRGAGGPGYGQGFQDRGSFRDNPRGPYTSGGGEPEPEEPQDWRARPNITRPPPLPRQHIPHHHQMPPPQRHAPISPPSDEQEERPVRRSYKLASKALLSDIVKTTE